MTPEEECEELMQANLPFASDCLRKYGEFYPLGAVMRIDKKIHLTVTDEKKNMPESKDVIENLEKMHKKLAKDGEIIASSILYDSKINLNDEVSDAITVRLEHIDNYCVEAIFPYEIKKRLFKREVIFYEPDVFEGEKRIFYDS